MTDYYVCGFVALWLCGFVVFDFRILLTPQKMSPTQYARTVQCTDEVMCLLCMVRYGTVRYYDTVRYQYRYGTVLYCTVPYRTIWYIYRMVRYGIVPY